MIYNINTVLINRTIVFNKYAGTSRYLTSFKQVNNMQMDKEKLKNKDSKISQQNHIIEKICDNGDIQYNCTACRKTFRSRSQKYYHLNCNQLENKLHKCAHCDKSFARLSQWKYHNESHISPVNECQKCHKIFSNPLALKKHIALHNVELKYCLHCDKSFKKKISLDHHIAAQHLNQLQYGCAYCNKKYASKSSLQLHLQTHEEKRFECSFCKKLFQRNSILKQHLKRHYNNNTHICNVCQKVFSESGALARHRKIHEEHITQYYCKLCDKNILRKDNMTRHLNTIHPEEKFENIVDIIKPSEKISNPTNMKSVKEVEYNTAKNIVIIENKLLQKPFELKDSVIDLPQYATNTLEYHPVINQIKVITALPTNQQALFSKVQETDICDKNTALNLNNSTYYMKDKPNVFQKQNDNTNQNLYQTEQPSLYPELCHNQNVRISAEKSLNTKDSSQTNTPPQSFNNELPKTISSVIRSIGNVKKHLTPYIIAPVKPVNNKICSEYKHKKYCHNNYNIDLYRKILGCDDDEVETEQDKEQKQNYNHLHSQEVMPKSATPVHWRKSFKNSYETSSL